MKNSIKDKYLVGGMIFLYLLLFAGISQATNYKDIHNHYAKEAIQKWNNYGVIQGYQGMFRPDDSITRGEMAVILNRIVGYSRYQKSRTQFQDLDDNFYTDALLCLNAENIIKGSDNQMRPKDKVSRQEAAVMIARAFELKGESKQSRFKDQDKIADWAKESINILAEKKFLNGYQGNIRPQSPITRAELVKMLDNIVGAYIINEVEIDGKKLEKELLPDQIIIIRKGNVKLTGFSGNAKVLVSASDDVESLYFEGSQFGEVTFLDRSRELPVLLEKTDLISLNKKTMAIQIYTDDKSTVNGGKLEELPLEKGINYLRERKTGFQLYPLPNIVEEKKPAYPEASDDSANSSPKVEPLQDTTELLAIFPELTSDGKIYILYPKLPELPNKIILAKKSNGENTGKEIAVIWRSKDMEKIKQGEKGIYILEVESTEAVIINEKNYHRVRFTMELVIQ